MGENSISIEELRSFLKLLFPNKSDADIQSMIENDTCRRVWSSQMQQANSIGADPFSIAKDVRRKHSRR